ncbi:MAG: VRR-NUC domain-containing protein [Candidatus Hodarchaeales archaeon]
MSESKIVKNIKLYLNGLDNVFVWKTHGSNFSINGQPDIVGVYKGSFLGIEVKCPDKLNTVSLSQQHFIKKINDCGGVGFVATSIKDVVDHLKKHDNK